MQDPRKGNTLTDTAKNYAGPWKGNKLTDTTKNYAGP